MFDSRGKEFVNRFLVEFAVGITSELFVYPKIILFFGNDGKNVLLQNELHSLVDYSIDI